MRRLGGRILGTDGAPREGAVRVDHAGRVGTLEEEPEGPVDRAGLVVPAPTNAHTHLADRAARGAAEGLSLEEAVAPPDGLKHRWLREADREELEASLRDGLEEVRASGATRAIDFREQGPEGARLAQAAAEGLDVDMTVLGRPSRPQVWEDEAAELAPLVDGIGISGLGDQPPSVSRAQARFCHEHDLILALHHSEGEREDLDAALALEPDLLVHGTHFTREDAARAAEADVPVVLCPRSNALFGDTPPLPALLDEGVRLGLGTDNAMFHRADVWAEAAHLIERFPEVDPLAVLEAACRFHLPGEPVPRVEPGARVLLLDDGDGLARAIAERRIERPWRVERAGRRA